MAGFDSLGDFPLPSGFPLSSFLEDADFNLDLPECESLLSSQPLLSLSQHLSQSSSLHSQQPLCSLVEAPVFSSSVSLAASAPREFEAIGDFGFELERSAQYVSKPVPGSALKVVLEGGRLVLEDLKNSSRVGLVPQYISSWLGVLLAKNWVQLSGEIPKYRSSKQVAFAVLSVSVAPLCSAELSVLKPNEREAWKKLGEKLSLPLSEVLKIRVVPQGLKRGREEDYLIAAQSAAKKFKSAASAPSPSCPVLDASLLRTEGSVSANPFAGITLDGFSSTPPAVPTSSQTAMLTTQTETTECFGSSSSSSTVTFEEALRSQRFLREPQPHPVPGAYREATHPLQHGAHHASPPPTAGFALTSPAHLLDTLSYGRQDSLEQVEPSPDLLADLRPYQREALNWMMHRERPVATPSVVQLPLEWEEKQTSAGRRYFLNTRTGCTSWSFPYRVIVDDPISAPVLQARGGILADEMGMGKTIELLSLILTSEEKRRQEMEIDGREGRGGAEGHGTLVVCPLSVLAQWKREIEKHSAPGSLSIYVYHGAQRNDSPDHLRKFDVVLTTYQTLTSDSPKALSAPRTASGHSGGEEGDAEDEEDDDLSGVPLPAAGLFGHTWHRVILDEAHQIKDRATLTARCCYLLPAACRWAVSGTPIQNKLDDIYSLIRFIRVSPYSQHSWWNHVVMRPIRAKDPQGMRRLREILHLVLLRRTKNQRENCGPRAGERIVPLPARHIHVRRLPFGPREKSTYAALWDFAVQSFRKLEREGDQAVLTHYAHILELLLRLRQSCDHPALVLESKSLRALAAAAPELLAAAQSLQESTKIGALLQELHEIDLESARLIDKSEAPVKSIIFSQWTSMLDLLEPALEKRGFGFLRLDGSMDQHEREAAIRQFNTDPNTRLFLISLKAGGLGLNLTAASRVFLLDPWWNPAIEDQAIDRVHRIGQAREVVVTRFVMADSVEERILNLQEKKRRLAEGALGPHSAKERKALRLDDLRYLFGVN